jgi:hypothetical protein
MAGASWPFGRCAERAGSARRSEQLDCLNRCAERSVMHVVCAPEAGPGLSLRRMECERFGSRPRSASICGRCACLECQRSALGRPIRSTCTFACKLHIYPGFRIIRIRQEPKNDARGAYLPRAPRCNCIATAGVQHDDGAFAQVSRLGLRDLRTSQIAVISVYLRAGSETL